MFPKRGQWWLMNTMSVVAPNSSIDSLMYFDHASASRICAPRGVYTLCSVELQFSAMQSRRRSGRSMFISAGASVSGVYWNRRRTPSITRSSPVWVISTVGAISPDVPSRGIALPSPQST